MKSPSDFTDSTLGRQDPVKPMNAERRISWQGQYHPPQFQASDGQAPLRPPYYSDKTDLYGPQPGFRGSPTVDPGAWQGVPQASGTERYDGPPDLPSPAHSVNSQYMEPHETPVNPVNSNGMSGAAAAAAAAMAAAAHTAQASPGCQKPQNAMHGKSPMPAPVQRVLPFHPNYTNVQQGNVPSQNVPLQDPGMLNHTSPYQASPGPPPTMGRPVNASQYHQWGPPPQQNSLDYRSGYHQPGYDGHSVQPPHDRMPFDSMGGPMSNASSHDSEDSRSKMASSAARSSSQKISALYEPDEPGRKDFIDRILRYWEEKELPLKHAPMMGGRTLDLFTLYQHVKKKNFFKEVTRSKEWSEVSSAMGLGSTSAAGSTLKKQYCKYLYGFECKLERGEPEPQEALGRVIEANRKKKQQAEQSQAKAAENSHSNMLHHQPQHPYLGHRPEYRPPHPPMNIGYSLSHDTAHPGFPTHSIPRMPPYEQQQGYPPITMNWQQAPHYPPHRPPSQPRYPYRSNGTPQQPPNSSGPGHFLSQPNLPDQHSQSLPLFDSGQQVPNQSLPPSNSSLQPDVNLQSNRSIYNPAAAASVLDHQGTGYSAAKSNSITQTSTITSQPPATPAANVARVSVPSTSAPQMNSSKQNTAIMQSSTPAASPSSVVNTSTDKPQAGLGTSDQQILEANTMKLHPEPTSGIAANAAPSQHDFLKSPEQQHMSDSSAYKPSGPLINNTLLCGPPQRPFPPNSSSISSGPGYRVPGPYSHHRAPDRPMAPGMYQPQPPYHQGYSPYHRLDSQSADGNYFSQKRPPPAMNQYGPPNKMYRPDSLPHTQHRDNYEIHRRLGRPYQRSDAAGPMGPHYHSYSPGMMHQQPQTGMRHHPPPPHHPSYSSTPRHMHPAMPRSNSPSVAIGLHQTNGQRPRLHQSGPPPDSAAKFLQGLAASTPSRPHSGFHRHPSGHVASSPYPSGSVEAVFPAFAKPRQKIGREVGVVDVWHIIMALKSGLLSESTWALNVLTILLHDTSTIRQILLAELPGLLHVIMEHYRYCLHQLFGMFEDSQSPCKEAHDDPLGFMDEANEKVTNDMLVNCNASSFSLTLRGEQHNYSWAAEQLQNPHSKLPVKVIAGADKYSLLLDRIWGAEQKPTTSDLMPISGLQNYHRRKFAIISERTPTSSDIKVDNDVAAELTFEDMLSIPSYIRCIVQNEIVSLDGEQKEIDLDEEFTIFPRAESGYANLGINGTLIGENQEESVAAVQSSIDGSDLNPLEFNDENNQSDVKFEASHIQSCLEHTIWSCDVALLEEEAAGFLGNAASKAQTGINSWSSINKGLERVFLKPAKREESELVLRILCLSNLIRSLSCVVSNHTDLCAHPKFFETLHSLFLLGHKHRVRCIKSSGWRKRAASSMPAEILKRSKLEACQKHFSEAADTSALLFSQFSTKPNEIKGLNVNAVTTKTSSMKISSTSNQTPEEFNYAACCEESGFHDVCEEGLNSLSAGPEPFFSSTVWSGHLHDQDKDFFGDPWWWECVHQLREDSLVVLANLSPSLNLSRLQNDKAVVTILDACLHWAVCSSADAQEPFPSSSLRTIVSSQSLGIEILTKLSMKEANVDLILATRPYSRLEKLFKKLTILVGNRKDQTLREFSIVLLSNLCSEETAARSVALQSGAVSNFLSFLEECEETGLNHQRMFPAGQELNCGTVSYMMQRCALMLLQLAKLRENRPFFLKHLLRLLSLSMSSLLGPVVQSLIAAALYELSHEPR